MQNLFPIFPLDTLPSPITIKTTFPSESISYETRITEITSIIVANAQSEIAFVILFGPFASGDFVANSDYNFLILTKEKKYANKNKVNRLRKRISDAINSKIKDKTHHLQLTIEPVAYANSPVSEKRYFFADIKRDGILLYDSGRSELLILPGLEINSADRIHNAKINYRNTLDKAIDFMRYCQFGIDQGDLDGAAFNLHQTAENLFNCTILVLNGYEARTHDLVELNKLCSANSNKFLNIFFSNNNEERRSFDLLRKAYNKSRYGGQYEISRKQLEYLADRVMILMEIVIDVCGKRINQGLSQIGVIKCSD
jgi:HEPN domain-containing protein/predicted nucleotidyltransferase